MIKQIEEKKASEQCVKLLRDLYAPLGNEQSKPIFKDEYFISKYSEEWDWFIKGWDYAFNQLPKIGHNVHELKTWPVQFEQIKSDKKKFEIRLNDRAYEVGDEILFREFTPKDYWHQNDEKIGYSGQICHRLITSIITGGFGLQDGYCCLGIEPI